MNALRKTIVSGNESNHCHRILIVDDEICIQHLNAITLRESGYQVDTAQDGEAAWEALCRNHYDLLVTDNFMPRMSGLELIKKLRAEKMTLPIIIVSATPPDTLNLGVCSTVLKPYLWEELLGAVKSCLPQNEKAFAPVFVN